MNTKINEILQEIESVIVGKNEIIHIQGGAKR